MRALVTGVSGFVGSHLVDLLRAEHPEVEVLGLLRWRSEDPARRSLRDVQPIEGDLLDAVSVLRAVEAARPDLVFHLGASSSVAGSWDAPNEMVQVNVLGTLHVLEALRTKGSAARVVLACSAEAYGVVRPEELPISENQPFRPVSPYAVSKAAADLLGFQYNRSYGLHTIRLRMFNHCGPRQSSRFVVASLARQVAEIEAGLREPHILVGNLEVRRDFVDVRDAVRAYWAAAMAGEPGAAYNVCSGTARSIRDVLHGLLAFSPARVDLVADPARRRPADLEVLHGDGSRFRDLTGWAPRIPFEQTLHDTLEYWRGIVSG
ncbi:MAG TPA: GDP-mannose 4,6-dehydratase [Thermoanaerobaculaceae bacterium]|nr:GDP-mannose 4,6-dehydratase [Thermoanaerobaculaceae bacterium]HRS16304.1 GDP-mannose 4,6-dehydratase [Thermoanaerobaculaceae bacterium]